MIKRSTDELKVEKVKNCEDLYMNQLCEVKLQKEMIKDNSSCCFQHQADILKQ